jgi:hypothetical protein
MFGGKLIKNNQKKYIKRPIRMPKPKIPFIINYMILLKWSTFHLHFSQLDDMSWMVCGLIQVELAPPNSWKISQNCTHGNDHLSGMWHLRKENLQIRSQAKWVWILDKVKKGAWSRLERKKALWEMKWNWEIDLCVSEWSPICRLWYTGNMELIL